MNNKKIESSKAPEPVGLYPHARKVGGLLFLSGVGPRDDFKTYNRIYAEYFADNQPCRTTLEIKSLPTPIAIELKVIATI